MQGLTLKEARSDSMDLASFSELSRKERHAGALTVVTDEVLAFFIKVFHKIQPLLSESGLHLHSDHLHRMARRQLHNDIDLVSDCLGLASFSEQVESEYGIDFITALMMDIFQEMTDHFVKIVISDRMVVLKDQIPKTKKQALRAKLKGQEASTSSGKKNKKQNVTVEPMSKDSTDEPVICPLCVCVCVDDPQSKEEDSIECSKCKEWIHFGCANLSGNEDFLDNDDCVWLCPKCVPKRPKGQKGKGKQKK